MFGRGLSEPAFVDAQFVVGSAASVFLHTEVHQSHSVAMDDGFRCRYCRNSICRGIASVSVPWTGIECSFFDNFHRSSSTLLLQFMASPHTKDLTNR